MEFVRVEKQHPIAVVTLSRGKANAINDAMLNELTAAFSDLAADGELRAIVIASDRPKFFSGGFDVIEVFEYGREKMAEFFGRFIDLYEGIFNLPKPTVAAVSGHAFAGGAILALTCDLRVMAEGDFGFAVNEINLGVVVPPGMMRMAVEAVGSKHARELLMTGDSLTSGRALEIGLAKELARPDAVLNQAIGHARSLAGKPPSAFAALKKAFRDVSGTGGPSDRRFLNEFLDGWFSPEAQQRKNVLVESLRG